MSNRVLNKTVLGLLLFLFVTSYGMGDFVSREQAMKAATSWLALCPTVQNAHFNNEIRDIVPYQDESGIPLFYMVQLSPSGFIILSSDDSIEPIIAFSPSGSIDSGSSDPFFLLLLNDLKNRVGHIQDYQNRKVPDAIVTKLERQITTANMKWLLLFERHFYKSIDSVDDPRIGPLVHSMWGQETIWGQDLCYNLYTPHNYPCGCVATAMAQLIRYHEYPTSNIEIGKKSYIYYVNTLGIPIPNLGYTRGGDGDGGSYSYSQMLLDPMMSTEEQRAMIGSLTWDCGLSVNMEYSSDGSGADTLDAADSLVSLFLYSNAIKGHHSGGDLVGDGLNSMVNANLDGGFPVLLGIEGTYGNHAVVCDGYGYNIGSLYHHLNMGWQGVHDVWYNLPNIGTQYEFSVVYKCVYNIFTEGSGQILSGRVTDRSGKPLSGVTISAGSLSEVTNDNGIYALVHIEPGTYNVIATKSGFVFPAQTGKVVGSSIDNEAVGNIWGVDFQAIASSPTVYTVDSNDISQSAARFNGNVIPNGATTTVWFEYGLTTNYEKTTTAQIAGLGSLPVDFYQIVSGLQMGTTYHFRAVAQNEAGMAYGEDHSFTTVMGEGNIVTSSPQSPVSINLPATLAVTILNGLGQPVANQAVTFSTTYPGIFSGNGASSSSSPSTVMTDANGQTWIRFTSSAVGTAHITIESPNCEQALVPVQFINPNGSLNVRLTIGYLGGDSTYSSYEVQAVVTNASGSPVAGQRVDFSTTRGSLSPGYEFTGTAGIADTILTITSSGDVTVNANAGGNLAAQSFYGQVGSGSGGAIAPKFSFLLSGAVYGLSYTPDGSKLIACGHSRDLKAWNTAGYGQAWSQTAQVYRDSQLSVSPDNTYFLLMNDDKAEIHYVSNGNLNCSGTNADTKGVLGVWTGNSTYLAASWTNLFRHSSVCAAGTLANALPAGNGFEREGHLDYSAAKGWAAACSDDGNLFVWTSTGSLVKQLVVTASANAYDTDFSSNGSMLAAVGYQTATVFNTANWSSTAYPVQNLGDWHYAVAFIDNDSKLAIGGQNKIEIVNLSGGASYRTADINGNAIEMSWNQSTKELAVGTSTGYVYIFKPLDPVDVEGPMISISTPAEGWVTNQSSTTTSGRITDGSGISAFSINGALVSLDGYGNFLTTIPLSEGTNVIQYHARDSAGNSTNVNRSVTMLADHIPPMITGTTVTPASGPEGTVFAIQARVVDGDTGVANVTAVVKNTSGTIEYSLPMSAIGSNLYAVNHDSSGVSTGNFIIDITAVDSSPFGNTRIVPGAAEFSVLDTPRPPQCSFTFNPVDPEAGKAVAFFDSSRGFPTQWQWDFGDGTTSNLQNPSHRYMQQGTYNVCLTAANSIGSTTGCATISVSESRLIGDLNNDFVADARDLLVMTNYLNGSLNSLAVSFFRADCNADGRLNAVDLNILLNYLAGKLTELPFITTWKAGDIVFSHPLVGKLRYIPAGTFLQGSSSEEPCPGSDEGRFTHSLSRSMAVMETEVTRQMWISLAAIQTSLPADPSNSQISPSLDCPVQSMTWYQAILYANLLSLEQNLSPCYCKDPGFAQPVTASNYTSLPIYCNLDANGYRMPTEGEWEYLARAGTSTAFSVSEPKYNLNNCSSCIPGTLPNLEAASWFCANAGNVAHPVKQKNPNPWNIYDVHGNVLEWCWDYFAPYPQSPVTDYFCESGSARNIRGGSFLWGPPRFNRSAMRGTAAANGCRSDLGFRLVRTLSMN